MWRRKNIRSRQEIKISGNNRGGGGEDEIKSENNSTVDKKKRKLKKGTGSKVTKGKEMEVLNRKAKNLGRFKV